MAIYAMADLHLSLGTDKPMDVFDGWNNYENRIADNWQRLVTPSDTVVIPGDISWAMKLENCYEDFKFINSLNGKKIFIKGNHDYWWSTLSKMNNYVKEKGFTTISFLFNNSFCAENISLCGTRSWLFDLGQPKDQKVMQRELQRLETSIKSAQTEEKIVFLHYPPVSANTDAEEVIQLLHKYNIKKCYYGHLHGASIRSAVQGMVNGIEYKLISADSLDFCPYKIL